MNDFQKIAQRMRSDWDRRIEHDYRFWMSDGQESDEVMWETGERDFQILFGDIESPEQKTILEVGCGVGRLIRAAIRRFGNVIGVDVSKAAIDKASELLGNQRNLRLIVGNGTDLS
ncbi:MAG: methyltransferase domain-containing protein, partial [Bdellovibrionales bacterium]|nr:methyltransferase domain-containing protein [Bdellovibrionales bacterium]